VVSLASVYRAAVDCALGRVASQEKSRRPAVFPGDRQKLVVVSDSRTPPRSTLRLPMARREFLRAGSLSLVGLGLPQLLQATVRPRRSPRRRWTMDHLNDSSQIATLRFGDTPITVAYLTTRSSPNCPRRGRGPVPLTKPPGSQRRCAASCLATTPGSSATGPSVFGAKRKPRSPRLRRIDLT
jgi:hypothetical protein